MFWKVEKSQRQQQKGEPPKSGSLKSRGEFWGGGIEKYTKSRRFLTSITLAPCELSKLRQAKDRQDVTIWLEGRIQPMDPGGVMVSNGHRSQRMCQNRREPILNCGY